MKELKVGSEYEMLFPFKKHDYPALARNTLFAATEAFYTWEGGCYLHEECDGVEYGQMRSFTGDAEGKVIYKILSIAEMPDRYVDRIIFKRWLIDPDGNKCNNSEVKMITRNSFIKDINSRSPFKADYEIV